MSTSNTSPSNENAPSGLGLTAKNNCAACHGKATEHDPTKCCLRCRNFSQIDVPAPSREQFVAEIDELIKNGVKTSGSSGNPIVPSPFTNPDPTHDRLFEESDAFKYIAEKLTQGLTSPTDKARKIFMWVSRNFQFDEAFKVIPVRIGTANPTLQAFTDVCIKILRAGKCVCLGFCYLYDELAREIGLEVEFVPGRCKSNSFNDDDLATFISRAELTQDSTKRGIEPQQDHVWLVVEIDGGVSKLIDVNWGSTGVQGDANSPNVNVCYFSMPNEEFVDRHFPNQTTTKTDGSVTIEEDKFFFPKGLIPPNYQQWRTAKGPPIVINSGALDIVDSSSLRPATLIIPDKPDETIRFSVSLACQHWADTKFAFAIRTTNLDGAITHTELVQAEELPGEPFVCDIYTKNLTANTENLVYLFAAAFKKTATGVENFRANVIQWEHKFEIPKPNGGI